MLYIYRVCVDIHKLCKFVYRRVVTHALGLFYIQKLFEGYSMLRKAEVHICRKRVRERSLKRLKDQAKEKEG